MIKTIKYIVGGSYYNITTEDINENQSFLYLTDESGNIIDFPDNTNLYFYIHWQKNKVEKINNKYIIANHIYYELQINDVIWSVENVRKWDYALLNNLTI